LKTHKLFKDVARNHAPPSERQQFSVNEKCELLPYLLTLPLELSRKRAKDLLRFGAVTISRHLPARHDARLEPGDIVTISMVKPPHGVAVEPHGLRGLRQGLRQGLRIVHLDDAIVVVDKPAGLLSMGSELEKERTAHRILNEHLKALTGSRRQQAFIVHRLDRETSGLMMFARNEVVQTALQRNWKDVTKRYQAVVEGAPTEVRGTLIDRLAENASLTVHRVGTGGELAITHYRMIGRHANKSLLEVTLETGRRHQIRVQLAAAGYPVVGDRQYGARSDPARRLALHSCELIVRHPISDESMEFRSPLPTRLRSLVEHHRSPRRDPPERS
jgi:23S rRNA pseudouridine1911/1915/1917 synthase